MALSTLNGVNGASVFVLVIVGTIACAVGGALRRLIHRYTPREIDWRRFENDD